MASLRPLLITLPVLLVAAPASAQVPGQSPNPSLDQYVESIPTPTGAKPTRTGKPEARGGLPAEARQRLRSEAGADAEAIEDVSTSGELGAPAADRRRPRPTDGRDPRTAEPDRSALPAAIDATSGGGSGTGLLLVLLAATAAAIAGLALVRRRATAR